MSLPIFVWMNDTFGVVNVVTYDEPKGTTLLTEDSGRRGAYLRAELIVYSANGPVLGAVKYKREMFRKVDPNALVGDEFRRARTHNLAARFVQQYGFPVDPKFDGNGNGALELPFSRFENARKDYIRLRRIVDSGDLTKIEHLFNSRIRRGEYRLQVSDGQLAPVIQMPDIWTFCAHEYLAARIYRRLVTRCQICDRQIDDGKRADARFCSTACRVAAHRERKRAAQSISA